MAKTTDSIDVDLSVDDTWAAASDLSRFPEWLVLHDGWRSPVPTRDELAEGLKLASVVRTKAGRVRIEWTVEKYRELEQVTLKGDGKGGVKAKLDLRIEPVATGSKVTFTVDLGGLPLIGPAGKIAVKTVSGDLKKSLATFREVFGGHDQIS